MNIMRLRLENNLTLNLLSPKPETVLMPKLKEGNWFMWDNLDILNEKYNEQYKKGLLAEVDINVLPFNVVEMVECTPRELISNYFGHFGEKIKNKELPSYNRLSDFFLPFFPEWEGGFKNADFYIQHELL